MKESLQRRKQQHHAKLLKITVKDRKYNKITNNTPERHRDNKTIMKIKK